MIRSLLFAALMLIALPVVAACSGGGGDGIPSPDRNVGVEGGACREDGTCNEGLVCKDAVCASTPVAGASGGACREDGTCNEGLVCRDAVCTPASVAGGPCREDGTCDEGFLCKDNVCSVATLEVGVSVFPRPFFQCPLGMAFIKGATFKMGSDKDPSSDELPVHDVTLSDYCMDLKEFSNGDKFAGFSWPSSVGQENFSGEKQPLVNVSWTEAKAVCEKLGKRLPTEAEWEYAARGGPANYEYGTANGALTESNACWNKAETRTKTCNVRSYAVNPLGLYDMAGNVWEWVTDWWGPYAADAVTDPQGPGPRTYRVVRGGSWNNQSSDDVRAANRFYGEPEFRHSSLGFRCAAAPKK